MVRGRRRRCQGRHRAGRPGRKRPYLGEGQGDAAGPDPPQRIERPGSARGARSGEVRWPWRRHRPAGRPERLGQPLGGEDVAHGERPRPWRSRAVAPQFGQANTPIANARRMRAAQVQLRGGAGGPAGLGGGQGRRPRVPPDHSPRPVGASAHGKPSHSTERAKQVTVHYRWHPLYGQIARVRRTVPRSTSEVLFCELSDGATGALPAWMTDAAVCAALTVGPANQRARGSAAAAPSGPRGEAG